MLISPPALAMKSGAYRTPCAARSSASPSWASWLLAEPHTTCARYAAHVHLVDRAPERARCQHVDVGQQRGAGVGPARARQLLRERAPTLVDVGQRQLRPRRARAGEPAWSPPGPTPTMATVRPRRSARAEAALAAGAHRRLHALGGERAGVAAAALGAREAGHVRRCPRPGPTCRARWCPRPRPSRSGRRACSPCRRSPAARRAAARRPAAGPARCRSRPCRRRAARRAAAALKVIARDRRSASRAPSAELW